MRANSSFAVFCTNEAKGVGGRRSACGSRWVVGGALVFEGEETVQGFHEGVFGGDAVAGQGVEADDVSGDRAGCECFGVKTVDHAGFPD